MKKNANTFISNTGIVREESEEHDIDGSRGNHRIQYTEGDDYAPMSIEEFANMDTCSTSNH